MKTKDKSYNATIEVSNSVICPDYDHDCDTMTPDRASWCFHGCQNHQCLPDQNLGTAKGYCPIIQTKN